MNETTPGKKVLLRCDDFGVAEGANEAIMDLAGMGVARNISIITCGPFVQSGIKGLASLPQEVNLGVHLAITSEWDLIKWGPVGESAKRTALVDSNGYFLPSCGEIAKIEGLPMELIIEEARAQITRALGWSLPISYIDEHMFFGWIHDLRPRLAVLAREFGLIYRPDLALLPKSTEFPREHLPRWSAQIQAAGPGPTLMITHPAKSDETARLMGGSTTPLGQVAAEREKEYEILRSESFEELLREQQVTLIGYRDLG